MTSPRKALTAAVLAALSLWAPGCGPETPRFDASTRYSPESLAKELLFRARAIKSGAEPPGHDRDDVPGGADTKASSKATAASKKAPARTLDELLDEVAAKAGLIPGMTQAQAIGRVAEEVSKDQATEASEKQRIADGLKQRQGSL